MFDSTDNDLEMNEFSWSDDVPPDLKLRLLDALSYSDCSHHDIWDEVRAWLEDNAVGVPEQVARFGQEPRPTLHAVCARQPILGAKKVT